MSDTSPAPVFEITYLGTTELHDVYHVAIYPALVGNLEAQSQYKQQMFQVLAQAKSNGRSTWIAVNFGHLTVAHMIHLSYRIALPFMGEPMTVKAYGMGHIEVKDAATKSLDWLIRHTFKIEMVANRQAALPPELAGGE